MSRTSLSTGRRTRVLRSRERVTARPRDRCADVASAEGLWKTNGSTAASGFRVDAAGATPPFFCTITWALKR